jgi:glycosyltransferase involved in cell wall biosynthesis
MQPEISLQYVDAPAIGYGRLGTSLARELDRMGVNVWTGLESPHPRDTELNAGRPAKRTNALAYISVPSHCRGYWKGQHATIFTMYETQRLPESFRDNLDAFDLVVVPSHQNAEMFGRYHDNVVMVPLGVDPEVWHYEKRPVVEDHFRFLIAGSGPRKGTDLAYAAFRKLWPSEGSWGSGPVPTLVMKNPRRDNFSGPRVEIIGGKIPAAQEVDLYATAHCFLAPSRGEGFGLQPLQAIAQGCPTILTGAHGHDSFAHLGLPVPADSSKAAAYFLHGDAGNWWEPDLDALCDRMKWVYDHYQEATADAQHSAWEAGRHFTWAQTATRFVDAIGRDRLEAPYSGPGEWVEPAQRRYRVVTARNWTCDVAGQTYRFEKGREYHETADLKRILWECGVLDPACVDPAGDDHGLTPEQVAAFGDYSAAHAYCHFCGQRLGSAPTRADDIEKALR